MVPVLAAYIAYSIAEKPGLVAGFVAGAIAKAGIAYGNIPVYKDLADKTPEQVQEILQSLAKSQV